MSSPDHSSIQPAGIVRRSLLCGLSGAGLLSGMHLGPALASQVLDTSSSSVRTRNIHGILISDPFGWLDEANLEDPQVARLIADFADASDIRMAPLKSMVQELRGEALDASPSARQPAPVREGEFGYWTDWSQGRRQLWRVHLATGEHFLLLDANEKTDANEPIGDFVAWGLSPDGRTLAFATMSTPEHHDVRFKEIGSGQWLDDVVQDVDVQITSERIVWTGDGRGIIYSEVNSEGRSWRARIHWLGHTQVDGPVLYEETDPGFYVEIRQTTSGRFALINAHSVETREVRLFDRVELTAPQLVSARRAGRLYSVDHGGGDNLDILTNDTHPNFRLVTARLEEPGHWVEQVAPQDRTGLSWHQSFRFHLALAERHEGSSRVRLLDRASGQWRAVTFSEPVAVAGFDRWTAGPEANRQSNPEQLRLGVETFAAPKALFDYHFTDGRLEALQATSSVKTEEFSSERLFASAPDGTVIPMSMIRPRGGPLRGAVLYGYGAYGIPSDPDFDPQRLSLLRRGVAYVIAHVRGGGDLGGAWHDAGRGERRANPVEDFIACARALTAQGITPPGRIVSMGRSAGGWLVGAALNRAPDLWAGMIADVPYVDVLTSLLDQGRALSASETSEVGDVVADPTAFARVLRLCPYQNLPTTKLPPVYLTASLADVRIPWSGVLKYVARLRAAHSDNEVAIRLDRNGNHWGPEFSETAEIWRAERVAFTLRALGVL